MKFEFATANQIIFGEGVLSQVGEISSELGENTLIVAGGGSVPINSLIKILETGRISNTVFRVHSEPDIITVMEGVELAKNNHCDFVIGFGGGSVLDTAKAIAAMLTNPGQLVDYLEVIGSGKQIINQAAPMIAIPTTAGTGTEVTSNAVIASPEHQIKVSLRSRKMIPTIALVDPELTYTMPAKVTANTGMEPLTQVIESYVSNRANIMTDIISERGIKLGAGALLKAFLDGEDRKARHDMSITSLFGGLALANGGLGAVHGFAGPIGGMFNVPHGLLCACLLPYVIKYNIKTLETFELGEEIRNRYLDIAKWVTGDPLAEINDGIYWIQELAKSLNIPGLRDLGIHPQDFDIIIEKSKSASSMQKNPVKLEEKILRAILEEAY
jgi:alcohol dehydrogenase class IV